MRPLNGIRVIELAGIGPGPHAGMMLADLGADVVRVERPAAPAQIDGAAPDPSLRGKRTVVLDIKSDAGRATLLELIGRADALLEGFRPGVTERLGIGPDECLARNSRLVYGRMTGWGQSGPMASQAGHDINYISITGALHAIGTGDSPVPPLNLVGDFGGGSMLLVVGVLSALLERATSGQGQVVDAAMVDGASLLMQMTWWLKNSGAWQDRRAANGLDGGAPHYRTYRCSDEKFVAVGCIEPHFYAELLKGLDLDPRNLPPQRDSSRWDELAAIIGGRFAQHPRDHWAASFEGSDACVTPVLALDELADYPHIAQRGTVVAGTDGTRAAPAPRFSRAPMDEMPIIASRPVDVSTVLDHWS